MNQHLVFKQEPFEMYPLPGARLPFVPIKGATVPNFEMPEMSRGRPRAQTGPRLRKVGQILILPNDDTSPVYGEIPLFYSGDDPDLFLGKIVRRVSNVAKDVGRVAQKTARTVGKAVETVKRATGPIGAITDFAWRMSPAGQAVTWGRRGLEAASAVARGERIDRILRRAAQSGIDDVRERLKFAEMVAPFVPGLGTGVAAALGAANALASGKPITEAVIAAARSAIPGGKIAQVGFDVAMNVARGKKLSEAALSAMRSQLPGGPAAQAAFDAGLALAQGKKLQDAAFAAAGRVLPPSRFAADAFSFARAVASGQNIQQAALSTVGQRVLQGKKIDPQGAAFAAARRVLPASPLAANTLSVARAVASGKSLQDVARSTVGQRVLQGQKVYPQRQRLASPVGSRQRAR